MMPDHRSDLLRKNVLGNRGAETSIINIALSFVCACSRHKVIGI